jgi:Mg2+-importing ATPase
VLKKAKVNTSVAQHAARVRRRLLNAAGKAPETLLIQYDTTYEGFGAEEVEDMREEYGTGAITPQAKPSIWQRLFDAFVNPFTIVLFALAAVSFITDIILAGAGERDVTAVVIVMTMVTVSGLLRFIQETRSGIAAEKLQDMVATLVTVQRRSVDEETDEVSSGKADIPLDELVVGDIIHLAAGDMIPADVRILQAKDLFISQASLTGESEPVEKLPAELPGRHKDPLELNNLAFMGTNVISGSAIAIALCVGDDTIYGSLARSLQSKKEPTSFEKGVTSVSWVLIRFMMVMVPVVLFINGFTKGDWMEAFLFAISVAVGLTPEMLPMIVSANLAKGAVSMAAKKVIVKDLNSIQNFGAMDVLCTDKTGTLTQDKIILEYHLDIHGNEDDRVLRHAFLNSYYQTGLRNLMDLSIIDHAERRSMGGLKNGYTKIDEIPWDFNRRRMSVVVQDVFGKTQLITKGAIEEMLAVSAYCEYKGKVMPLTEEIRAEVLQTCRVYNHDGMRVVGLAQKTRDYANMAVSVADEDEMVLIGYLAFLDPPKESAGEAIATLKDYGVEVKVLTGDNDAVTRCVCRQVGLPPDERIILGAEIEEMDDEALKIAVEQTHIFAKLSPAQKARIVLALRSNGHVVGFMGDGINDALALRAADVGISVDTAVDIAKESGSIILLEKDLMVLEEGAIEGRRIYANIIKYIKMTASSNFGNMFSVLVASAFLPFLPMLPIQILVLNLIYDISCVSFPWDNVDADYLRKPRKWDASSITKFMFWLGPTSSVFDITTYAFLMFWLGPAVFGGAFHTLGAEAQAGFASLFHTGWFVLSLWTQTLVIHMLRTPKIPFIQSRASWQLTLATSAGIAVGTLIPYTPLGYDLGMMPLPAAYFPALIATILGYMVLVTACKKLFIRKHGELL